MINNPNAAKAADFFDHTAHGYDKRIAANGYPANDFIRDELLGMEGRPTRALDLGAGTGLTTEVLLPAADRVTSVDVSGGMLDLLRKRCAGVAGWLTVEPPMPVEQYLQETSNQFDAVTAIGLVHFLPDAHAVIAGAARVLRPGGRFMFTFDPHIPGHPQNGATEVDFEDIMVYHHAPEAITADLAENGLQLVGNRRFVAQPNKKRDYQADFVVARRPYAIAGTA